MNTYLKPIAAAAAATLLAAAPAAAQVDESVPIGLAQLGINVDAETLTDEQMIEIEAVLNTDTDETTKVERIERIMAE